MRWGNSSDPATVKIKIEKPNTRSLYADMDGDPAHKATPSDWQRRDLSWAGAWVEPISSSPTLL